MGTATGVSNGDRDRVTTPTTTRPGDRNRPTT
jgi:hypothetical protein